MYKLNDELENSIKLWAEGNEYLYSLLHISWEHGIRTGACCGGHSDRKKNDPYILFIIDENNLPYFESMLGTIEDIPDALVNIYYRHNKSIPGSLELTFSVHCMMHNRMEIFYKLAQAILEKKNIKTENGKRFYQKIIKLLNTDRSIIEKELDEKFYVGGVFTTYTPEREKYISDRMKVLYFLKKSFSKDHSKYDDIQERIEEEPQIRL